MRSIGRIIAENRKKKQLSQPELAKLLSQQGIDVTAKAISKWETDAREPGLHVFLTLCKLLDIEDIYDAYFGKNPYSVMNGLNQEGKDKIKDFPLLLYKKLFTERFSEVGFGTTTGENSYSFVSTAGKAVSKIKLRPPISKSSISERISVVSMSKATGLISSFFSYKVARIYEVFVGILSTINSLCPSSFDQLFIGSSSREL